MSASTEMRGYNPSPKTYCTVEQHMAAYDKCQQGIQQALRALADKQRGLVYHSKCIRALTAKLREQENE